MGVLRQCKQFLLLGKQRSERGRREKEIEGEGGGGRKEF